MKGREKALPKFWLGASVMRAAVSGYDVLDGAGFVRGRNFRTRAREKKRGNDEQYKL